VPANVFPGWQRKLTCPRAVFRSIELPMLRQNPARHAAFDLGDLPDQLAVALKPWAVAPRPRTIELAIYQAFRFDFDLNQCAPAVAGGSLALPAAPPRWALVDIPRAQSGRRQDRPLHRWERARRLQRGSMRLFITLAAGFPSVP